MDVRGYGDMLSLNLSHSQDELETAVRRLSSGLRVTSAEDDPSGLAIAQTLETKVAGLDQGMRNVQDAGNALNVAEGAMQTIAAILQRMRSLVVQGRNDLISADQRGDLQTELDQLRLEIDRIAGNTTFNGKQLLDGSLSSLAPLPERVLIVSNSPLTGGGTLIDTTIDPAQPSSNTGAQQVTQLVTVDSYDPVADQLNMTVTISSQDPTFGPSQSSQVQVPNGTNFPVGFFPPSPGNPTFTQTDQYFNPVLAFNIGTLTAGDVGASSLIVNLPAQNKAKGSALTVNTGSGEGSTVAIDIGAVDSASLGVNDVILSSDDLVNEGDEARIDYAIHALSGERARIGAQAVALQETSDNASIAAVNYQSAESAIRDVNVASEATDFTRLQILVAAGTRMTRSLNNMQLGLYQLLTAGLG
jgi:flagellin